MKRQWRHKWVSLEFKFCGLNFFKLPLLTLELKDHFTTLQNSPEVFLPDPQGKQRVDCFLVPAHPIKKKIPPLSVISGYLRYCSLQYSHYYILINGSFTDYLQKFAHKARYNLLRTVRLYNDFCKNETPWKEYSRPEDMDEFYRLASEVSEKSYQERLLGVGLPKDPGFFKQLKQFAAKKELLGCILFYDQKPVAYICCKIAEGRIAHYWYVGYDPQYQRWSPGRVLLYYVLKNMFDKGEMCIFDFTRGGGAGGHKDFFSNNSAPCMELYYFRCGLRNLLIILSHWGLRIVSEQCTRLLVLLKVKESLVRLVKSLSWNVSLNTFLPRLSKAR